MKAIIVLLSLAVTLSAHANMQYKVEDGKLLSTPSAWSDTGVKVTPEAAKYPKAVIAALSQPGVLIEAEKRGALANTKMVDMFHHQSSKTTTRVSVVYHQEGSGVIRVVEDEFTELMEAGFNPYIICWLISVGLMAVAVKRRSVAIACIAFALTFYVIVCATPHSAMIFAAGAIVFALFTVLSIPEIPKEQYIFFSRVFYFLMSVSAAIMYYPLFT